METRIVQSALGPVVLASRKLGDPFFSSEDARAAGAVVWGVAYEGDENESLTYLLYAEEEAATAIIQQIFSRLQREEPLSEARSVLNQWVRGEDHTSIGCGASHISCTYMLLILLEELNAIGSRQK